ncbi:MAG: hypothetical protein WBQ64_11120 [Terriglobales bacterium]
MGKATTRGASILLALSSLLFVSQAVLGAELPLASPYIPRPFGVFGFSINGSGYQQMSEVMGAGLRMDSPRILSGIEVGYGNARKVNDATINNHSGHERSVQARAFYRQGNGLYFGGGAQWSQTSTTNYSKQAWRPTLGIGKDFMRNTYSLRLQSMYMLSGSDKSNGSQGPEISFLYPSPASNHHLYFRTVLQLYRFHTTDTFSDPVTSARQRDQHHFTGNLAYSLMYRF